MDATIHAYPGAVYRCLRNSQRWQSRKGNLYVYESRSDELVHYTKRTQTRLLNGRAMIEEPGAFELVDKCPFCECRTMDPILEGVPIHDSAACANNPPAKPTAGAPPQPGRVIFACGAHIVSKDCTGTMGTKVITQSVPALDHARPIPPKQYLEKEGIPGKPEDLRMNCLLFCPCTKKESGREVIEGWFEDGKKGRIVKCRIKAIETNSTDPA